MRRGFWVPSILLLDASALHDILAGEQMRGWSERSWA